MSTKRPSTAAAAAICGDTRCVRPPRPWRPSKLRLEVDAQRSPGASVSGFMPRHIEQPAVRQSKPAARKTSSRPSFSAWTATCWEPGTTIALTLDATLRPRDGPLRGPGHAHRVDAGPPPPALDDLGRGPQVADPRVRAGADEHAV